MSLLTGSGRKENFKSPGNKLTNYNTSKLISLLKSPSSFAILFSREGTAFEIAVGVLGRSTEARAVHLHSDHTLPFSSL